jgi:hypothetical protein
VPVPVFAAVLLGALVVLVLAFVVSGSALIWVGLVVGIAVGAVIAASSADGNRGTVRALTGR